MTQAIETTAGKVVGVQRDGHQAFLGIPFARPPVGELRFRAPQPVEPWGGVRQATEFASSALQGKDHPVVGFAATGPRSEDCLYLNVYTPAADGEKRPVLVWIHGGAFAYGSGSETFYDGRHLALRGDAVVVSIHYRLGALGFAYLGEHGGQQWGADENVGALDQVAALQWVHDNIAAFGGDPQQVTVFGESAGAVSVAVLMAMPAARGLFQRAVCQSGTANRLGNAKSAAMMTGALLKAAGIDEKEAHRLRELDGEALVAAQLKIGAGSGTFSPIYGGPTMPKRGIAALRDGDAKDIALLVGTNRDEVKLFAPKKRPPIEDGQLLEMVARVLPREHRGRASEAVEVYRQSRTKAGLPTSNIDLFDAISGDSRFRVSAVRMAAAQAEHQPRTYLYLFTHESPARGGAMGSAHALEIPFVFGTLDQPYTDKFTGSGPEVDALSDDMMDSWLAFARSGDPSHAAIGTWPSYDSKTQPTMIFGPKREVVEAPFAQELALWADMLG